MSSAEWNNYQVEQLKIGDELMIFGNLRARLYEQRDGKKKSSIRVKARWVYPLSNYGSEATRSNEAVHMNRVDIMAQICFDITNSEKCSIFTLAHHYNDR